MITYKKGGLLILSSGVSVGITYYLEKLLEGTEPKNIILPILVAMGGFVFFFLFVLLDFITGIYASKRANQLSEKPKKNIIKSYKLYRTLWKVLGVVLLNSLICALTIFSEMIQSNYFYVFALWSQVTIWVMACGFEFHSIGENIEKFSGNKPEIFLFLDKIIDRLQVSIFKKIDSLVMKDEREEEEINQNTTSDENNETKKTD